MPDKSVDDIRDFVFSISMKVVEMKSDAEKRNLSTDFHDGALYIARTILSYIDGKEKNG